MGVFYFICGMLFWEFIRTIVIFIYLNVKKCIQQQEKKQNL